MALLSPSSEVFPNLHRQCSARFRQRQSGSSKQESDEMFQFKLRMITITFSSIYTCILSYPISVNRCCFFSCLSFCSPVICERLRTGSLLSMALFTRYKAHDRQTNFLSGLGAANGLDGQQSASNGLCVSLGPLTLSSLDREIQSTNLRIVTRWGSARLKRVAD
jgi:hypothetical protein